MPASQDSRRRPRSSRPPFTFEFPISNSFTGYLNGRGIFSGVNDSPKRADLIEGKSDTDLLDLRHGALSPFFPSLCRRSDCIFPATSAPCRRFGTPARAVQE